MLHCLDLDQEMMCNHITIYNQMRDVLDLGPDGASVLGHPDPDDIRENPDHIRERPHTGCQ